MNISMRRFLAIFLFAALALAIFSGGCGNGDTSSGPGAKTPAQPSPTAASTASDAPSLPIQNPNDGK